MNRNLLHVIHNEKFAKLLCLAFLFLGVFLRIKQWIEARSLMIDEAAVVNNTIPKSFFTLLNPLDQDQFAPVLFLWVQKSSGLLFGYSELGLRLFPALFGLLSLYLFYFVGTRYFKYSTFIYPIAIFSMNPMLVRFSSELKQYGLDVFFSISLLYLSLNILENLNNKKDWVILGIVGVIAIFSSMPSIFFLAPIGILLLIHSYKNKIAFSFSIAISGIWALLFLLNYFLFLDNSVTSDYLFHYHQRWMIGSTTADNLELILSFFSHLNGFTTITIITGVFLWITGGVSLFKQNRAHLFVYTLPFFLTIIASALHLYSLIPRLLLFLFPALLFQQTVGLKLLFNILPRARILISLIFVFISLSLFDSTTWLHEKYRSEYAKDAMTFIAQNYSSSTIIAHHNARAPIQYYQQYHPNNENWNKEKYLISKWDHLESGQLVESIEKKEADLYFITHCDDEYFDYFNSKICVKKQCEVIESWGQSSYLIHIK